MIFDIRCRYVTAEDVNYFSHSHKVVAHSTPESFFSWLDEQGIDVVMSPTPASLGLKIGRWDLPARKINNELQAELQNNFPTRFVGVAGIDPGNEIHNGLKELERCVKQLGLRVAAIEPGRLPMLVDNPADERLYDFYALASELDVPVIIQTSGLKGGISIDYANPRWIDKIAQDFPNLHIICAHGCAPYIKELALVTRRRANVFASPDLYTFVDFQASNWIHGEQLLFASGYPFVGAKNLKESYLKAPWGPRQQLDNIMYRNAIRAFKLERIPYFSEKLSTPNIFAAARANVW